MEESKSFTTIIVHDVRLLLKLTCNEYCILDLICWLEESPEGWCPATRQDLSDRMGISKQATHKIIEGLIESGLLEKNSSTKMLRTTDKWKHCFAENIITEELVLKKDIRFIEPWHPKRTFKPFTAGR